MSWAQTDAVARSISSEITFDELVKSIRDSFSSPDSIAKCAYFWIAENIEYDYKTLQNGAIDIDSFWVRNSFEQVVLTKTAVCAGYTSLFQQILTECGVESVAINGTSRQGRDFTGDYILKEDHAWNAYKSENRWNLVDVTWASTTKENNKVSTFYFQTDPKVFVVSHYPSNTEWQLLDTALTYSQFKESIYVNYRYFEIGLGNLPPRINRNGNKIQLLFDYHDYWRPKVYEFHDTTLKEVTQTLDADSVRLTTSLTFEVGSNDLIKIEANWIGWGNIVFMNYPEIGFLKINKKEITGAKNP